VILTGRSPRDLADDVVGVLGERANVRDHRGDARAEQVKEGGG
jgi:hypothetical protein